MADDKRYPITNIGLEPARAAIEPVDDDSTVSPGRHVFNRYAQSTPDMAQQFGKCMSATKLEPRD